MSEPFKSQALEANLAQTRYKDIFIPEEHQQFIALSAKYFGINDFWFYTRDDIPADAYNTPSRISVYGWS